MLRVPVYRIAILACLWLLCSFVALKAQIDLPAEPNNSFGAAHPLALGTPLQDAIVPRGDVDWYMVSVDHPGELQIAIGNSPATLDIDVRVWNANRDTISDWFAPLN